MSAHLEVKPSPRATPPRRAPQYPDWFASLRVERSETIPPFDNASDRDGHVPRFGLTMRPHLLFTRRIDPRTTCAWLLNADANQKKRAAPRSKNPVRGRILRAEMKPGARSWRAKDSKRQARVRFTDTALQRKEYEFEYKLENAY